MIHNAKTLLGPARNAPRHTVILWDTIKEELPIEIPKLLIIQNQLKTEIIKIKEHNINPELF